MGIDPAQIASPWHAAAASFASFTAGAILPLLAITLTPAAVRIAVTAIAVLAAFAATGAVSATLGQAPHGPAVVRNVVGGLLAMGITYGIGSLVGHVTSSAQTGPAETDLRASIRAPRLVRKGIRCPEQPIPAACAARQRAGHQAAAATASLKTKAASESGQRPAASDSYWVCKGVVAVRGGFRARRAGRVLPSGRGHRPGPVAGAGRG